MGRKSRIMHLLNPRMLCKEICDRSAVLVVGLHPDGKRLCTTQNKERIKRREDRTGAVLHKADPFGVLVVIKCDKTADAVRMAVQVFGRRMHDDIYTVLDRTLEIRRKECVVADDLRPACVSDL